MTIPINKNNKKNVIQIFNDYPFDRIKFKGDGFDLIHLYNDGKTLVFYPDEFTETGQNPSSAIITVEKRENESGNAIMKI